MTRCACQSDLQLYFDGELESGKAALVKEHLLTCESCARDLREMQELSALFIANPADEMNDQELGRLHGMVDQWAFDEQHRPIPFPWFKALSAVAASVLIIASAWLVQSPVSPAQVPPTLAATPDWARTAITLQVEPLPPGLGQSGLADRGLDNWILDSLTEKPSDASSN